MSFLTSMRNLDFKAPLGPSPKLGCEKSISELCLSLRVYASPSNTHLNAALWMKPYLSPLNVFMYPRSSSSLECHHKRIISEWSLL